LVILIKDLHFRHLRVLLVLEYLQRWASLFWWQFMVNCICTHICTDCWFSI